MCSLAEGQVVVVQESYYEPRARPFQNWKLSTGKRILFSKGKVDPTVWIPASVKTTVKGKMQFLNATVSKSLG
jgi:hypothetical protein